MASKNKDKKSNDEQLREEPPPTLIVWSVRGISLIMIVGLLVYFTYAAFQGEQRPVFSFDILKDKIENRGTGWVLPVEITNKGSNSVHSATIETRLLDVPGQPMETIELLLVGPGETKTVEFWFDVNPMDKEIVCEVASYLLP